MYRIFYIVLSLSIVCACLFPFVILLRLLMQRLPKKYTIVIWGFFYLRAVCPWGMSSVFCLSPRFNRLFHLLQQNFGLRIVQQKGLMVSWREVFRQITVSSAFRMCTVYWVAGMLGLLIWRLRRCQKGKKRLRRAVFLYDGVYSLADIERPVYTGIFRRKMYVPEGMPVHAIKTAAARKELSAAGRSRLFASGAYLVTAIHWFNPLFWLCIRLVQRDLRQMEEEALFQKYGEKKDAGTSGHSGRKWAVRFLVFGIYLLCLLHWFGLSFLYTKWNGGAWNRGVQDSSATSPAVLEDDVQTVAEKVIARAETKTSSGKTVKLRLIVEQGEYRRLEGYRGNCRLELWNNKSELLDTIALSTLFDAEQDREQRFAEDISLEMEDYNRDGTAELSIGQSMRVPAADLPVSSSALTAEKAVTGYYLINIGNTKMEVISDLIYVSDVLPQQSGSMQFAMLGSASGILSVPLEGREVYYVWSEAQNKYERREMSEEEANSLLAAESASGSAVKAPEQYNLLDDDGRTMVQVDTQSGTAGEQKIEKVVLTPEGYARNFDNVKGKYYSLAWAAVMEEDTDSVTLSDEKRYAVLTYSKRSGRGFVIFDVRNKSIYYRQKPDNQLLGQLFEKYGESEITFAPGGSVIYQLEEIGPDNVLKINYAAGCSDGTLVRGSFQYNVESQKGIKLEYSSMEN